MDSGSVSLGQSDILRAQIGVKSGKNGKVVCYAYGPDVGGNVCLVRRFTTSGLRFWYTGCPDEIFVHPLTFSRAMAGHQ